MSVDAIMIKETDNVATALREITQEEKVIVGLGKNEIEILIKEHIPYGHKFSVKEISEGDDIIKYGEIIGRAVKHIDRGFHAHIQNIESLRGRGDLEAGDA
jgi:altronate dehydratase small subunit